MTSIYGRNHLEDYIRRAADNGLVLYVDAEQWSRIEIEGDLRRMPGTRCLGALEGLDDIIHHSGSVGVGARSTPAGTATSGIAPRRAYSFRDIAEECGGPDDARD